MVNSGQTRVDTMARGTNPVRASAAPGACLLHELPYITQRGVELLIWLFSGVHIWLVNWLL